VVKKKKALKKITRKQELEATKDKARKHETYGDLKVSRRIPEEIAITVQTRDAGKDFGRPNHKCDKPGAPHHITHFENFLTGKIAGNPHTLENLEAPCKECHKLAHELHIPSGTSIETFFREKFQD
jgi:hypothetical protein